MNPLRSPLGWLGVTGLFLALQSAPGCSCNKTTPGAAPFNRAPVANAGADSQVLIDSQVTLDASGSHDPDGNPLLLTWAQSSGDTVTLSDTAAVDPTFSAPSTPGVIVITLTVSDGDKSATDSVSIIVVTSITNAAPIAAAGADRSIASEAQVTLDGTASSDPDGDPLTFAWSQVVGPIVTLTAADGAQPYFTTPLVSEDTDIELQLVVNDGELDSAPDTIIITVLVDAPINQPPVADAGPDQTVDMTDTVTLTGAGSDDPETDPLTYSWAQTAGPSVTLSDSTAVSPTFDAPVVTADTPLTFGLVVNDGTQDSLPDSVTITVNLINRDPVVDSVTPASPQSLDEGGTLTYTIVFSDPDGDPLTFTDDCSTYAYVTCTVNGNEVTVEISPPFGTGAATVDITITADDGQGGSVVAAVSTTVNDVNDPPQGSAAPTGPYAVTEQGTLTVVVTFTDADGDTLSIDDTVCNAIASIDCTDNGDGTATVTITPASDEGGDQHSFDLVADDGNGNTASVTIDVTFLDQVAPTVGFAGLSLPPSNHLTNAGDTDTNVTLVVDDAPDGDTPYVCSLDSAPSYVAYDDGNKEFTITPSAGDPAGAVVVTCTDADGSVGTGSFDVGVNEAPTAAFAFNPDPVPAGSNADLVDGSTDPNPSDTHTCVWTSGTATFVGPTDQCSGVAVMTTDCGESHTVSLTITDSGGLTANATNTINAQGVGPYVAKRATCTNACGSRTLPWCSIQAAIAAAAGGTAFNTVFVAPSTVAAYNDSADGPLVMVSNVSLAGGYATTNWAVQDRFANATVIETMLPDGIEIDSVSNVTISGFQILSEDAGTGTNILKSVITVTDCDATVEITDNTIDATDLAPGPTNLTAAIALVGDVGILINNNTINGGNGALLTTAIGYAAVNPGDTFTGIIADHLAADGNGILGGIAGTIDTVALNFLGPVGLTASITNNDIDGGLGANTAYGIVFADIVDLVLGDNASVYGGGFGGGGESAAIYYSGIGDGNSAIIDGATTIDGGWGDVSVGVLVNNPGDIEIRNAVITGGDGTDFSTGVRLRGAFDSTATPLTALIRDSTVTGGTNTSTESIGINSAAVSDLEVRDSTIDGGVASNRGIAIRMLGAGTARLRTISATGNDSATDPWSNVGTGISTSGAIDLTLTDSTVTGGRVRIGTGLTYILGANPTGFTIGGNALGDGNIISGAQLDSNGMPEAGGFALTGIRLMTRAGEFTNLSSISNNVAIYGGAPNPPNASPGSASPQAIGILNEGVDNVLVEANALIQGCAPCSGAGPLVNTPYGIGIRLIGGVIADDPTATGGFVDNTLIAGGPLSAGTVGSAITVGISTEPDPSTGIGPSIVATGNTIFGNNDATGIGTAVADAVRITAGDVVLGTAAAGNPHIEGGIATSAATGIRLRALAPASVVVENNALIAGNMSNRASPPGSAYGIHADSAATSANNLTILDNARIVGGYAWRNAIGISATRARTGPISGNNIAAGVAASSDAAGIPRSLGLELLSVRGTLTVSHNLIEGCGLYNANGTAHDPVCETAQFTWGAQLTSVGNIEFWNNRVYGGYGTSLIGLPSGVDVVGVGVVPMLASISFPTTIVAHNYIDAQGAATSTATAFHTQAANGGVTTGLGWYVMNNIMANGGTAASRHHVYEFVVGADLTGIVVMNNAFVPDTAAVVYHEDRGALNFDWGSAQIVEGCGDVSGCLDDDDGSGTVSATAQTVLGQNNYEGNRVIDPLLAGSVTALRETPRNLQLPDWAITAAALQGVGYDFGGANPHAVNGPTNDYMGDVRGSPPDIGHDEQ